MEKKIKPSDLKREAQRLVSTGKMPFFAALLASVGMIYLVLSGPASLDFLKSRSLPLVVLLTLSAVLTGWLRARDPKLRHGLFFKSSRKRLNNLRGKLCAFVQPPVSDSAYSILPGPSFICHRNSTVTRSTAAGSSAQGKSGNA